jgi:hypothetical protein
MALLSLLAVFRLSVRGFTNRDLRTQLASNRSPGLIVGIRPEAARGPAVRVDGR